MTDTTDGADTRGGSEAGDTDETLFRATFERAPVGIAHLTPAGRWLRVNDQLCAIVGYTREDLLARTFQDITHPDDLAADLAQVQRLLAGAIDRYSLEKRYIRADGRTVWINLTVTLVRDAAAAPRYFISVVEDISARKRAEEDLRRAVDLRDDVLAVATHDLRTPLTAIHARAQVVQARVEQGAPPDAAWINAQMAGIVAATRRMLTTISHVDDVARLQMGQALALMDADLDLEALVRGVIADTLTLEEASRIRLRVPATPLIVRADLDRLGRIVQNLLGNALKYSPSTALVRVRVAAAADVTILTVRDRGVGIPADEIPRLFARFYRASTAQGIRGTGLGLYGARAIVEQLGGQLTLESTVGRGTTVTLRLPRR